MIQFNGKPIDEIVACRELDALVAREMGLNNISIAHCLRDPECGGLEVDTQKMWQESTYGAGKHPVYVKYCVCDVTEKDCVKIDGHTLYCYEPIPFYSTNIQAAWEIAEKMRDDWVDWGIYHNDVCKKRWEVTWGFDGYGWPGFEADTAPLAICIAFLLSKEVISFNCPGNA